MIKIKIAFRIHHFALNMTPSNYDSFSAIYVTNSLINSVIIFITTQKLFHQYIRPTFKVQISIFDLIATKSLLQIVLVICGSLCETANDSF